MHFLIVRLSSIGDVIFAMPAVAALRRRFPHARITWVAERQCAELLRESPAIDALVEIDTRAWRNGWFRTNGAGLFRDEIRSIRKIRPDVAIDFQGLLKSAVIARLSGAPKRIGFAAEHLREPASRFFYSEVVRVDPSLHVARKNLCLLESFGVSEASPLEFPIAIGQETRDWAGRQIESLGGRKFAIVNPGGGWSTKLWEPARFAQVADWLWERFGINSIVTFGPGEEHLAGEVVSQSVTGAAMKLRTSLKQFAALAEQAVLFVGSDTGPMHLAAARGVPVVGLYGPTQVNLNGPLDPRHQTVARDVPCRIDCYRRRCDKWICMDIPAQRVQLAIERRLDGETRPQ